MVGAGKPRTKSPSASTTVSRWGLGARMEAPPVAETLKPNCRCAAGLKMVRVSFSEPALEW